MTVKIYKTPSCVQCGAVMRAFDKAEVSYEVIDLSQDPALLEELKSQGFRQAPIVEYGDIKFAGFNPGLVNQVISKAVLQAAA